jgi:hypothetical protein
MALARHSKHDRFRFALPILRIRSPHTGSNALIGGRFPLNRSTCTVVIFPVHPCAKDDVPTSGVSTFGLPWTQSGASSSGSIGSYQALVGSWTMPGATPSVTRTAARQGPRAFKKRMMSPSAMPRGCHHNSFFFRFVGSPNYGDSAGLHRHHNPTVIP